MKVWILHPARPMRHLAAEDNAPRIRGMLGHEDRWCLKYQSSLRHNNSISSRGDVELQDFWSLLFATSNVPKVASEFVARSTAELKLLPVIRSTRFFIFTIRLSCIAYQNRFVRALLLSVSIVELECTGDSRYAVWNLINLSTGLHFQAYYDSTLEIIRFVN